MDPYALKHAIEEAKQELVRADIDSEKYNDYHLAEWGFKILLIAELKQLNRNIEHLSGQVNRLA